jgi:uncharacterized repeat protein (TIGR03803 family)
MRPNRYPIAAKTFFAIYLVLLLMLAITAQPAQAQTFKVLRTFHGKDGGAPYGTLVLDGSGNLYGTTGIGGAGKCSSEGCGTVFKMDKAGKEVWLRSFKGANGWQPVAGLLRDSAGNLFGTTTLGGGVTSCGEQYGCGTVFKVNEAGTKETVLHRFGRVSDGFFPESLLVEDKAGNLYGTAYVGGKYGLGMVFKIGAERREKILYNFTGGSDGCAPYPGVTLDSEGNLYGVAAEGGNAFCNDGDGVVFKVDPVGNETVLHTFGGEDGSIPSSTLLF